MTLPLVLMRFPLFTEFVCTIEFLDFTDTAGRKHLLSCSKKFEHSSKSESLSVSVEVLRWELGVMVRLVDPRSESESEESSSKRTWSSESLEKSPHESQLQESLRVWKEEAEFSSGDDSRLTGTDATVCSSSSSISSNRESSSGDAMGARPLDSSQMTSGMSDRARDMRLEEELDADPIPLSSDVRLLRMEKLSALESPLTTESLSLPESVVSRWLGLLAVVWARSSRNNLMVFLRKLGMKSRVLRLESFFIFRTSVTESASGSSVFIGWTSSVLKSKMTNYTTAPPYYLPVRTHLKYHFLAGVLKMKIHTWLYIWISAHIT